MTWVWVKIQGPETYTDRWTSCLRWIHGICPAIKRGNPDNPAFFKVMIPLEPPCLTGIVHCQRWLPEGRNPGSSSLTSEMTRASSCKCMEWSCRMGMVADVNCCPLSLKDHFHPTRGSCHSECLQRILSSDFFSFQTLSSSAVPGDFQTLKHPS